MFSTCEYKIEFLFSHISVFMTQSSFIFAAAETFHDLIRDKSVRE